MENPGFLAGFMGNVGSAFARPGKSKDDSRSCTLAASASVADGFDESDTGKDCEGVASSIICASSDISLIPVIASPLSLTGLGRRGQRHQRESSGDPRARPGETFMLAAVLWRVDSCGLSWNVAPQRKLGAWRLAMFVPASFNPELSEISMSIDVSQSGPKVRGPCRSCEWVGFGPGKDSLLMPLSAWTGSTGVKAEDEYAGKEFWGFASKKSARRPGTRGLRRGKERCFYRFR